MSSKTYLVGDYCRYSSKEDDAAESNSIQSQRDINIDFVEYLNKKFPEDTFFHVASYSDDDYTGTNFNRPDFQHLKHDCLTGKINCIIVKDHSRFARNAARMTVTLEDDFTNIRYISNLDNFDSKYDDYDSMFQIKNTFNQMYAEDISKKVHSSIDKSQKSGKFIGSFCCYGYKKNRFDKHSLEIDENVQEVVESIFRMRLEGINLQSIARKLNEMGVLSPSEYKKNQGFNYKNPHSNLFKERQLWTHATIHRMLTNETYKGNLTQGRKRQKMRKTPIVKSREDYVIAKNSCPAIISAVDFDEAQRLLKESNHIKLTTDNKPHMFAGIIKCGECLHTFSKHQKGLETLYYTCRTRRAQGVRYCDNQSIRADILEKIVLDDLNAIISEIKSLNSLVDNSNINTYKSNLDKQLKQVQADLERAVIRRRRSYSDFQDDTISKADFLYVKKETEEREQQLTKQLEEIQNSINNCNSVCECAWIKKLLITKQIAELDRSIIQEMIENIYIYKDNRIKIVYKFAVAVQLLTQQVG